ncbi:MAG: hypothetical protein AB7I98_14920 [Verrucomicrobiales bacterium]
MNPPAKLFRASSIGAGASLLTVVLLMLGNPSLVLTFFLCVVYAVVPFSLWYKHRTIVWRGSILITCAVGFGLIATGVIIEMIDLRQADDYEELLPGFASLRLAFLVGVVFLPLAGFGSMHSLVTAMKARRGSSNKTKTTKSQHPIA